jgi:hypothetical protein
LRKRRLVAVSAVWLSAAAGFAAPAAAGEVKSYTYDALGRLVVVQSAGTVNDGEVDSLCYDRAGNRKSFRSNNAGGIVNCVEIGSPAPASGSAADPGGDLRAAGGAGEAGGVAPGTGSGAGAGDEEAAGTAPAQPHDPDQHAGPDQPIGPDQHAGGQA